MLAQIFSYRLWRPFGFSYPEISGNMLLSLLMLHHICKVIEMNRFIDRRREKTSSISTE